MTQNVACVLFMKPWCKKLQLNFIRSGKEIEDGEEREG